MLLTYYVFYVCKVALYANHKRFTGSHGSLHSRHQGVLRENVKLSTGRVQGVLYFSVIFLSDIIKKFCNTFIVLEHDVKGI